MSEYTIKSIIKITCKNETDAEKVSDLSFELSSKINDVLVKSIGDWLNDIKEELDYDED